MYYSLNVLMGTFHVLTDIKYQQNKRNFLAHTTEKNKGREKFRHGLIQRFMLPSGFWVRLCDSFYPDPSGCWHQPQAAELTVAVPGKACICMLHSPEKHKISSGSAWKIEASQSEALGEYFPLSL